MVITDDDNYYLLRFIVHKSKWLSLLNVWLTGVDMPFDGEGLSLGFGFLTPGMILVLDFCAV